MSLFHSDGNTIIKKQRATIPNPMNGVEIDYYFTAKRVGGSNTTISMRLWTVIVDYEGFAYAMLTKHFGLYNPWKELIETRLLNHLLSLNVDKLQAKRLLRDIEIKKEGHLISYDLRMCGDKIGIRGEEEIYIRKDKFNFF